MEASLRKPARSAESIVRRQRWVLLRRVEAALEIPMVVLGLVWLALLVVDLLHGLSRSLELIGIAIWIIFIVDFVIKLLLAPAKMKFLARNWLTVLALLLPALRVLRIFRALRVLQPARAIRGLRLARVLTSLNRGMRSISATMQRRGLGYLVLLTLAVTFAGAAGMYAFEGDASNGPQHISSYGNALWWTSMIMTTMGTDYWPVTSEGRILCLLLGLYAFTVFGYVTASLATFFIGKDAKDRVGVAGAAEFRELKRELEQVRQELRRIRGAEMP
jgi:voltage-gated potassium channel